MSAFGEKRPFPIKSSLGPKRTWSERLKTPKFRH